MPEIDACFGSLRASFKVSEADAPLARELYAQLKGRFSDISRQLPEASDTLRLAMMLFGLQEELSAFAGQMQEMRDRLNAANASLTEALRPREHLSPETESELRYAGERIERLAEKLLIGL